MTRLLVRGRRGVERGQTQPPRLCGKDDRESEGRGTGLCCCCCCCSESTRHRTVRRPSDVDRRDLAGRSTHCRRSHLYVHTPAPVQLETRTEICLTIVRGTVLNRREQVDPVTPALNDQAHTHTHPFNGPLSGTTQVSRYEKGKTNLDFTEARDSEWQWHQLGHMQVCTSLQTDNHASTPPLSFYRPAALPATQPTASKH